MLYLNSIFIFIPIGGIYMNLDKNNTKKVIFILCTVVLFCAALLNLTKIWTAIKFVLRVLLPVLIGLAVAFIMTPMSESFEKELLMLFRRYKLLSINKKIIRSVSVTLAFLVVVAIIAILVIIIIPQMRSAFRILSDTLPSFINSALSWIDEKAGGIGLDIDIFESSSADWFKMIESALDTLKLDFAIGDVFGGVVGVASSVVGAIFNFAMGVIIGFKLILQREAVGRFYRRFVRSYTSEKTADAIFSVVKLSTDAFRNFITGQLTEAMALGLMCFIGMLIFRFPYAGAAATVIGICAVIPYFGAWIGGIIGTLLALTVSPLKAVLFVVFLVCLQTFDNYFVYPKIIGNSMDMPGLLVMLAVLIGGDIAGVAGMLLGVPFCFVVYTLMNMSMSKRLKQKKIEK